MKFSIAIPQFSVDGGFDPAQLRAFLGRAEDLCFEGAWTQESVLGTMSVLDPIGVMAFAAACTDRIRLGCSVFVLPLHSPVHLAKSLSSLDQMTRGRLEVGVGTGGGFRAFPAFGVEATSFIARFNESLRLIRELWTTEQLDFDGRFWQLQGVAMEPKPFQKPGPPVWFGGSHPDALRRAVRDGDGFFGAGSTTTAAFADQVMVVRQALAESGRDPSTFPIAKRVYLAIDDDPVRAKTRISAALGDLYGYFGRRDLTPVAVHGGRDDVISGLHEVIAAGAQQILLNPMFDDAEQMERLAAEVIPELS